MGRRMIGRMAAGACGICLCYGLVVQAVQGQPDSAAQTVDAALVGQSLASAEELPDAERFSGEAPAAEQEPQYDYEWPRHRGHGGRRHRRHEDGENGESDGWEPYRQEPEGSSDTEEDDNKRKKSEEQQNSSDSEQNSSASGDPPTLNQFLSGLRCGGCGHNCSLLNPRCMRGRSKAERAQTEYAETYGSDAK